MGAAQTTVGHGWKQPSDAELRCWRRAQSSSIMIQQLTTDVDAQYHCYQPYLLLTDIVHLYRTCRIWCHWIRSPDSVAHQSSHSRQRREGGIVTVRNSSELHAVTHTRWIQEYLTGCRISPPLDQRSNSWINGSIFNLRFIFPLLTQLASLQQIQHLTLDHVHPNELTTERIQTYFTAVAPTLRSFELFPTALSLVAEVRFYGHMSPPDVHLNRCLNEIHLLTNLEELRLTLTNMHGSLWQHTAWIDHLPNLLHLHTFHLTNNEYPYADSQPIRSLQQLASCKLLKHCAWGRYAFGKYVSPLAAQNVKEFILARGKSRKSDLSSVVAVSGGGDDLVDPMEFLELHTIHLGTELWNMIVNNFPNLKILSGHWQLSPHDWSSLTSFKLLTDLEIVNGKPGIEVNHFLPHLIQCRTIQRLILGEKSSGMTETHIRAILSNLTELTDLTLSSMVLETVVGFSEPNELRHLTFNYCRGPGKLDFNSFELVGDLNVRATLPSIPTLTHLTLLERKESHLQMTPLEQSTYAQELFARMPRLRVGQFVEKTYKREEFEPSIGSTHVSHEQLSF